MSSFTLTDLKVKFYREAQKAWPKAGWPDWCVVLTLAGIDPIDVLAEEGSVSKKSYLARVVEDDGKIVRRVRRQFTPEQRKIITQYWELLNDDMKVIR